MSHRRASGFLAWFSAVPISLWNLVPVPWQEGLLSCQLHIDQIDELLGQSEHLESQVTPSRRDIFSALTMSPADVSVVVVGQDPYPTIGHAVGRAFAVPLGTSPLPGSLRNILKEIETDLGRPANTSCDLAGWAEQGVLLLNTSLTTQVGSPGAHSKWPWQIITYEIVRHAVERSPAAVALLWGKHASKFSNLFPADSQVLGVHPSPLSAHRGFFDSKPFSKVNSIRVRQGNEMISW